MKVSVVLCVLLAVASAKVFFNEDFSGDWESRWAASSWKPEEQRGKLGSTAGKHGDGKDTGVQTTQDARFYTYAAKIDPPFSSVGKKLILQYTVKHEQNLDCGGAYLKFLKSGDNLDEFKGGEGETPYNIMFGPDWCGSGHRRIHAIFEHEGKNHLNERLQATAPSDQLTHLFALHVHTNNSYSIYVDNELVQFGSLAERPDYAILPEKEIPDPAVSKPADWVDDAEIDDPEDKKPDGYDEIPSTIADPEAKKPEDWDDELDGEWEAPQIANPDYKGEWKPKKIPNPAYKGPWQHPTIANPDYKVPEGLGQYESFGGVGIEIWQVKSGSIFDNILITDDDDEADAAWAKIKAFKEVEKEVHDKEEEEKRKQEAAEAEKRAKEEADKKDDKKDDDADDKADDDKEEL